MVRPGVVYLVRSFFVSSAGRLYELGIATLMPTRKIPKRQRNSEYVKFLLSLERAPEGNGKRTAVEYGSKRGQHNDGEGVAGGHGTSGWRAWDSKEHRDKWMEGMKAFQRTLPNRSRNIVPREERRNEHDKHKADEPIVATVTYGVYSVGGPDVNANSSRKKSMPPGVKNGQVLAEFEMSQEGSRLLDALDPACVATRRRRGKDAHAGSSSVAHAAASSGAEEWPSPKKGASPWVKDCEGVLRRGLPHG